ncbi:hypothetical protein C2845_PM12G03230 [Panicum miliaceum]|uniref:non-specific serine/threonine protein kinase n=1 Tax=Panicum miliaceum TaxID=4540 RepID=A0A3L6QCQ8_PANMI|nr:hypothetical protein C2845_PM12G03230 [Panicum miliaceum]
MPSIGLALVLLISLASCASSCTELERTSLLQFLTELSQDADLTKFWQGTDCCPWEGIACNQNGTVTTVSLPYKGLEGRISQSLGNLTGLQHLNLSYNSLSGGLPPGLVSSSSIIVLDVSFNQLNGDLHELPSSAHGHSLQTGQLKALISLDISCNNLTGPVPPSIGNLTNLQVLDLSNNNLTGEIPAALGNLHFLARFNVSNNNLEGPIPTGGQFSTFQNSSFYGNPKLCGSMLVRQCSSAQAHPAFNKERKRKAIFAIAFGVFFAGIAIVLLLGRLLVLIRLKSLTSKNRREDNRDVQTTSFDSSSEHELIMMPQVRGDKKKLTFSDIVKATNNFDQEHIIGCGGYGLVYKAELPDGSKLAIKKLNGEMCLMEREFNAEVEALSMAHHDHLVPLWGYGIQGNSRFFIYSFMENGSLDDWLHNRDDDASTFLDWPTRLRIAQGASCDLSYIHNVCKPHIVHRDIKSSNILLDKELKAYVADFGLSRLILPNKTHVTTELVGTLGYIPPEYGQGWVATLRGDIYSFGVVLLELLTGLRPVPVLSTSKELVPWVLEMRSQGKHIEVLDPTLRGTGHEEQMLKVLEVACKCVNYNPSMRPPIMEVVSWLESINTGLQTQKLAARSHNLPHTTNPGMFLSLLDPVAPGRTNTNLRTAALVTEGTSLGCRLPRRHFVDQPQRVSIAPKSPRASVTALGNKLGMQEHGARVVVAGEKEALLYNSDVSVMLAARPGGRRSEHGANVAGTSKTPGCARSTESCARRVAMGLPAPGVRRCQRDAGTSSTAVPPDRRLDKKEKKNYFSKPSL